MTEASGAPETQHPGIGIDEHGDAHPVFEKHETAAAIEREISGPRRATAEVVKNGDGEKAAAEPLTIPNARALEATAKNLPVAWEADPKQLKLLKSVLVPPGITDDQFELFVLVAKRLNLDPFKRQIYAVPYRNKSGETQMVIQTGIDGYRASAARVRDPRTGETLYDGQDAPEWCDDRGKWTDAWIDRDPPEAARVSVWRKGVSRPFVAVARFRSYAKTDREGHLKDLWATMPDVMIAKCAEALALRKAFPDELGGVYTVEEMEQAENDRRAPESTETHTAPPKKGLATEQQQTLAKVWQTADDETKAAALAWLRDQRFTGDTPRVAAVDKARLKDKKTPLSATGKIFTHFGFDATAEQFALLMTILAPEPTTSAESFDPDEIAKQHGETPPPDAPTEAKA